MSDPIERQDVIDEAEKWIEAYNSGRGGQRERDAIKHVISGIKKLPSAQPKKRTQERTETRGVCLNTVDRQAVEHLDWFTKLYCRDKSITDDLAFKCEQCEFEMPDDRCLVKVMARKLCPDYKDFGAMGDL